jgi:hypothetical protein
VNLKRFHADFGNNPVDARIVSKGLTNYDVDADVKAKLNLGELTQMFPLEGLTLRGLYNLNLKAKGLYSDAQKKMPAINAAMSLANGYVKSKDFPAPIEQLNFNATVNNATGQMADAKINVPDFRMVLEGEPLAAKAYIENLDNYTWDASVKGGLNLTKLTKIYPLEDMTVTGHLVMDIDTKGKMSDVEAERYEALTTSGTMRVEDLTYTSTDLPQGMKIAKANMNFTPREINITSFTGTLGKSDISVTGSLSNYMAYLFRENQTIRGNMAFNSRKFDVNEWMVDDPNAAQTAEEPMTVVEVPKNIDFTLVSTIDKVLYDNMTLDNMKGTIIVRDGAVRMDQVAFNSLGGSFVTNGTYERQEPGQAPLRLRPRHDQRVGAGGLQDFQHRKGPHADGPVHPGQRVHRLQDRRPTGPGHDAGVLHPHGRRRDQDFAGRAGKRPGAQRRGESDAPQQPFAGATARHRDAGRNQGRPHSLPAVRREAGQLRHERGRQQRR